MANIVKELNTRIALKYDSYANWADASVADKGANLVLLAGEIGLCYIGAEKQGSNVVPTVLFKVGDGSKKFADLPWASAKAADVYAWAKSETVVLDDEVLKFKTGETVNHTVDLSKFALNTELNAAIERIATLEDKFGANGDFTTAIAGLDGRLDVIEGSGEGSIAKALADAKAYTDEREAEINKYADQAEADAKSYADAEVAKDRKRLDDLEAADAAQDLLIAANTQAIADEADARADADAAINKKFGAEYSETATVAAAIADAKQAGTDAAGAVAALAAGQVAANKVAHEANAAAIAANTQAIADEASARVAADNALSGRLDSIEAFFEAADHDGEGENGLMDALDTLKEIQEYLNGDGTAAQSVVGRIAANEEAIGALQGIVEDGGTLEARVDDNEEAIATLKDIVDGYTAKTSIKNAIEAAQDAADNAQADLDTLESVVGDANSGLVKKVADLETTVGDANSGLVKQVADLEYAVDANDEAIADLDDRMSTAEGHITTLQGIVSTGDDSNDKLRAAITELQGIVTGADANATLRTDLKALADIVNNETTGLAATKAIADEALADAEEALERVAAIEADYLKAADEFIINCGSSSEVVHVKAAQA